MELVQPEQEQPKRRSYADMNAAISNWPEEDPGNPFQAHSGLGMYGFPEEEELEKGGRPGWNREERSARTGYEPFPQVDKEDEGGSFGPAWSNDHWSDDHRSNDHRSYDRSHDPVRHRTPGRNSGWKVIGSVTGAIVTGALFGMVVLSFFNKEAEFPIPGLSAISESAQKAVQALPVVGELKQEETSGAAVQIALPAQTYYFLQYGVFSSADGVDRAQQELKDAGYAAAQDTLDDSRVYAGISADREQAKLLSSELKSEGVDLILHEASIPSAAAVPYSKETGTLEQYAVQSAELVKLLSETSASLLLEESPDLADDQISALKDQHVQFTKNAAAVRGGFSGSGEQLIENMETEMNSAVEALLQFDKTKAKSHLWEVQNSMMRYVLDEQRLFSDN